MRINSLIYGLLLAFIPLLSRAQLAQAVSVEVATAQAVLARAAR